MSKYISVLRKLGLQSLFIICCGALIMFFDLGDNIALHLLFIVVAIAWVSALVCFLGLVIMESNLLLKLFWLFEMFLIIAIFVTFGLPS